MKKIYLLFIILILQNFLLANCYSLIADRNPVISTLRILTNTPDLTVSPNQTICSGNVVTLTATGTGVIKWYDGATLIGTGLSVSVQPTVTTTYSATLDCGVGCTDTKYVTITIATSDLNVISNQTICIGNPVNLTATGSGTIKWFDGPTQIGTGTSINVSPTQTTSYTVKMDYGTGCSDTKSVTVNVNTLTDAGFTYPSNTICVGSSDPTPTVNTTGGTFTVDNVGLVFSNTSTGKINMSASSAGNYNVTYSVTGICPNSQTQTITITTSPDASFTYPMNNYCQGQGTILPTFTTGSAGVFTSSVNLSINATNGAIDLSNSLDGFYTITNTIAASGVCPMVTSSFNVTIKPKPTVDAGNDIQICSGNQVTLTANGANTYSWDNGVSQGVAFTPSVGTIVYTVTGTGVNLCTNTDQVSVTVNSTPTLSANANPTTFCDDATTTLTANTSSGSLSWYNGSVFIGYGSPLVVAPNNNTTYTVIADDNGCTASSSISVTVNPMPTINAGFDQTVCSGNNVTLNAAVSGGIISWDNGVTNGIPFTPTATNNYTATTVLNGCSASDIVTVNVNPLPNVIAGPNQTVCVNYDNIPLTGSPAGGTYSGDGLVNNGNSFSPYVAGLGQHTLTYSYTDINTCSATSTMTITVNSCLGIEDMTQKIINIYPNPANNFIELKTKEDQKINNYQLISMDGKLIEVPISKIDSSTYRINLQTINQGIYILHISLEDGEYSEKIIVLK